MFIFYKKNGKHIPSNILMKLQYIIIIIILLLLLYAVLFKKPLTDSCCTDRHRL